MTQAEDRVEHKEERRWRRNGPFWFTAGRTATDYEYDSASGQLRDVRTLREDFCPNAPECPACDGSCQIVAPSAFAERHVYDIFGRRSASLACEGVDPAELYPGPGEPDEVYFPCKWETVMYDYDGLSQRVVAERKGPIVGPSGVIVGDRYVSTFTYGAMGLIARTDEAGGKLTEENNPAGLRDHYYLSDAMGGHAAMLIDDDGDGGPGGGMGTPRIFAHQVFDAFGNRMTGQPMLPVCIGQAGSGDTSAPGGGLEDASIYQWRGWEGSETDQTPNLIHMQSRDYDPTIGRFLQADSLPIASMTTQGMNRYIYTENDPVNMSDPRGKMSWGDTMVSVRRSTSSIGIRAGA